MVRWVAIPLRGYVVCNEEGGWVKRGPPSPKKSQSPYGAMSFATDGGRGEELALNAVSQSPYGAMSFATSRKEGKEVLPFNTSRNPLTGLCRLQLDDEIVAWTANIAHVAIPLRGYVVCNSTPLRTPFWTALSEGGL